MSTSKYKQRLAKERKAAAIVAAQQAAERRRRLTIIGAVVGAIVLIALIAGVVVLTRDDGSSSDVAAGDSTSTTAAPGFTYGNAGCAPTSGPPSPGKLDFADTGGFQACVNPDHVYTATIVTSAGTIDVTLDAANVPGTVNNFVQLAGWGYYNGSQLFRTDPSIGIVQGGAPHTNSATDPGPGYTIDDEGSGFTYQPGQLVMARTAQPNSAGAQFFFTADDKSSTLDATGTYVVFGTVTSGLDILQKILASNVQGTDGLGGHPDPTVTITSITVGEASLVDGSTTTSIPVSSSTTPDSSSTSSTSSSTVSTSTTVAPA